MVIISNSDGILLVTFRWFVQVKILVILTLRVELIF